ncbi:hypothetical protein ACIQGT_26415 [Streptomyces sp. NPDC093108]|uniref:hypothetical protein n=1 Tax=Streptomyces sp. NPDC093108 TaxID=3366030 RepID=UPI00380855D1
MPVLTAPPPTARPPLTPTGGRGPVERAVVAGALAAAGPETLVRTDVPQPDGSVRLYAAWTDRGGPLADRIDRIALARGLDAWSWVEILTHNHARSSATLCRSSHGTSCSRSWSWPSDRRRTPFSCPSAVIRSSPGARSRLIPTRSSRRRRTASLLPAFSCPASSRRLTSALSVPYRSRTIASLAELPEDVGAEAVDTIARSPHQLLGLPGAQREGDGGRYAGV